MKNEEAVISSRRLLPLWGTLTPAEKFRIARYVIGTVFAVLVFAGALMATDLIQFRMRMPGYIILYWFPALMAGRAAAGYRGSGIIASGAGGSLANAIHPPADSGVIGFVLAAFIVEVILFLVQQKPAAWLCILMGMAAGLGKMAPKVAIILTVGVTPHHNRQTLPFMLQSYLLFGGLAGLIYLGGRILGRKAQSRISSAKSGGDSGYASVGLLVVIVLVGIAAAIYA